MLYVNITIHKVLTKTSSRGYPILQIYRNTFDQICYLGISILELESQRPKPLVKVNYPPGSSNARIEDYGLR